MTNIFIDIETVPGDLDKVDEDIRAIVESGEIVCPLKKGELVESLGDPKLKYKTIDELVPMWLADPENAKAAAMETYKKRALDGSKGKILSWSVGSVGGVVGHIVPSNEVSLLTTLADVINEKCKRKDGYATPFFIGHNVAFDLKFLFRRFVIHGINPGFALPFGGWHSKDYWCNSAAWCGRDGYISQDNLCRALGIEGKPDGIDGSSVFDYAMQGRFDEIQDYNNDDVAKCRLIYERLTFTHNRNTGEL